MSDETLPPETPLDESQANLPEPGIIPIHIEDEMQNSYIDYSMSVIIGRALPDARDGLKPVHRRCLYTMSELGNTHNKPHKKSARVVGDVMGKYHPHGDSAIYDTIVRMAQPFSMRYQLVDGHGNFGSIDGDAAAAMRYTEVRMHQMAEDLLEDLDKETVDMGPNYDETLLQPLVLPSKIPNLLLNGSTGIAVGMATNIPPHNLNELCDAVIHLVDNPACTIEDLMQYVKGPDFPTGGIICGTLPIRSMYRTGRGSIRVRGRAEIIENGHDSRIVITEIPYVVNKAAMIEHMAELVKEKVIEGIRDIRDESKADIRIVIELKRDAVAQVVLNLLYKHTQLQTTFGATLLALDHGRPKVMNLKQLLRCFLDHRIEVITRRTQFDLRKAQERCHILEGFRIAIDHMDEIVRIIRQSHDDAEARFKMQERFGLSDAQCTAILDMRLRQLTGLARDKVEAEYQAILIKIADLKDILANPQRILNIIKEDCEGLKVKYGDERRTEITYAEGDVNMEDIIANEPCVITLSSRGYIKRGPLNDFDEHSRGGKGRKGAKLKEGDFVMRVFNTMTHDRLLFFTSHGRLFTEKAYQIPETERTSFGKPLVNLLMLRPEITEGSVDEAGNPLAPRQAERVLDIIAIESFAEDQFVFFATRKGIVKKTRLSEFKNVHKAGLNAIRLEEDDELIGVTLVKEGDDMLLVSANGQSMRFKTSDVRVMGRTARGVRGIRLAGVTFSAEAASEESEEEEGLNATPTEEAEEVNEATPATTASGEVDSLRALVKIEDDPTAGLLMLVENGFGTCTSFEDYPTHHRGGKGVKSINTGDRNGKVVFAGIIHRGIEETEETSGTRGDSIMVITAQGILIRTSVDSIRQTGRTAKGVRIIRLSESDRAISATVVKPSPEDETVPESEIVDAEAPAPEASESTSPEA